jgi:hypothetical protein
VLHQRHKRLLANSSGAAAAGDEPFAVLAVFATFRPDGRWRDFANSIHCYRNPGLDAIASIEVARQTGGMICWRGDMGGGRADE